jgi:excisionase family DNA binding protein
VPEWMTVDEAAEYLRCSRSTIYRRIKDGELKLYKAGKMARLKKEDLDKLFEGK